MPSLAILPSDTHHVTTDPNKFFDDVANLHDMSKKQHELKRMWDWAGHTVRFIRALPGGSESQAIWLCDHVCNGCKYILGDQDTILVAGYNTVTDIPVWTYGMTRKFLPETEQYATFCTRDVGNNPWDAVMKPVGKTQCADKA